VELADVAHPIWAQVRTARRELAMYRQANDNRFHPEKDDHMISAG
jgi:hypothetical protein